MKYNKLNLISHTPSIVKFSKKTKGIFLFSYAPLGPYPLKFCKNEPCSIIRTSVIFVYSNGSTDEDAGYRMSSQVQLEHQ